MRDDLKRRLLARLMPATRFQRQQGPFDGHSEWSVIANIAEPPDPELLAIAVDAIAAASRTPLRMVERCVDPYASIWPGEHYRLLPALCDAFGARRVVEVGTWRGESALALLESQVERVDTFDIVPWNEIDRTVLRADDFGPRLRQHVADLAVDFDAARLASADVIFLDGPKDGVFERAVLPRILALPGRRMIVLDDIRVMTMVELWRGLPEPKLDVTSFGHWSGTGLLLRP